MCVCICVSLFKTGFLCLSSFKHNWWQRRGRPVCGEAITSCDGVQFTLDCVVYMVCIGTVVDTLWTARDKVAFIQPAMSLFCNVIEGFDRCTCLLAAPQRKGISDC